MDLVSGQRCCLEVLNFESHLKLGNDAVVRNMKLSSSTKQLRDRVSPCLSLLGLSERSIKRESPGDAMIDYSRVRVSPCLSIPGLSSRVRVSARFTCLRNHEVTLSEKKLEPQAMLGQRYFVAWVNPCLNFPRSLSR